MVRIQRCVWKALPLLLSALSASVSSAQKFFPDDPLQRFPEVVSPGPMTVQTIDPLYDYVLRSVQTGPPAPTAAGAVNSLGEVPDSSWFTNRGPIASRSEQELRLGGRNHGAPQAPYEVVAAKTEGVTPGFRIRDARGLLYFVKVDSPGNPEMATAADVVGSLFLYAFGYNVPENYILLGRPEDFRLSSKASITALSGKKHKMSEEQLRQILGRVPKRSDGRIRVMASLSLPSKIIGPFLYQGTRSDDPNDIVPHETRRDLRGLEVVFAWLNHTDAKSDNSLDTLEGKGDAARVVHHLLDFGDSFGSDSDIAKDPRHGQEYPFPKQAHHARAAYTLGLRPAQWETVRYPKDLPAIGNFTSDGFDPFTWKPNYPNQAFSAMLPEDAYWAAKRVMEFRHEQIQAIVSEAQFTDPAAAAMMTTILERRRDAIGRAWFSRVLPVEEVHIDGDQLVFEDLDERYRLRSRESYGYSWFRWMNDASHAVMAPGSTQKLPGELAQLGEGMYMGCIISSTTDRRSVTVYFNRAGAAWKLVGVTRSSL